MESARTESLAAASPAPPWARLGMFSFLNVIVGMCIVVFLARSSSRVSGFAACLVFLGISYLGWFVAGVGLWKKNFGGLSSLAIASSASAALCLLMRVLVSSRAATGFNSEAFQVAANPFELASLWVSLARWLTFLPLFYAATSAFLFLRFRHVWVAPRGDLVVPLFPLGNQMRVARLWWLAVNSFGVALSVILTDFGHPADMTIYHTAAFAAVLALLGALQVVTSCWIISLVKVRIKIFLMTLGSIVGILAALGTMILGMTFLWVYAAVGFWSYGLTGIVFGAMAGHSQWSSLSLTRKSP